MLGSQIIDIKMEDNKRDNDNVYKPKVEHRMIINWTPPDEKKFFLKRRFVSTRMLSKSIPRRNKSLLRYKMSRSLNFDIANSRKNSWLKSPNSSFDSSSDMDKSSCDLSRSAKIMRALSLNRSLIRHKNLSIRRSLNFDSPKKSDDSFHSDSTNADTASSTFEKLLKYDPNSIESVTSSVLIVSSDSIDENQNQTPQKTRKIIKTSNDNIKENLNYSSESSSSTSLPQNNLEERINILHIVQTPDIQSFKRERSKILGCVSSTPRNLFQEFNQDEYDRPCTPEHIMHLIPKNMSTIKKSHKKEKLYRQKEDMYAQQINVSARNKDLYVKTREESSGADKIIVNDNCDTDSVEKCQINKKNVKKTLVYDSDDELSDSKSDNNAQSNKSISKEDDSSENIPIKVNINGTQETILNDYKKYEGSIQDNDDLLDDNDKKKNQFDESDCDKEVCLVSHRKSSNTHDMNASCVITLSPTLNSHISQNSSRAVTPENHINIFQQILAESIKKSHKKVKQEHNKIFTPRCLYQKVESAQNNKYKNINAIRRLSSQNSIRPNTPDNLNSSRILLTQFNSVKKSHKKDKNNKRISGLAKCHKYQEYRKKKNNLKKNEKQKNSNEILSRDSLELTGSPNVSNKKKKSVNMSVQSEMWVSPCSKSSLECNNIKDEFKIYTPIKRTSLKLLNTSYTDEMSLENNEQAMPQEIDFSRCMTPIAHYSKKWKENEDAIFEKYAHVDKSKTDTCISFNELANTADAKDKDGRSTPINMSTTELLCDVNSIKKSHKKNKHSHSICKRKGKESSHNGETKNVSFANSTTILKENAASALQLSNVSSLSTEMEMCSNTKEDKNYEESIYNNPKPSTSHNDSIKNETNINELNHLNATPPNDFNTANFITLFNTTSIKKFHKKERDYNAETKYILMSSEEDLSDDGSIFDENDRLNFAENFDSYQNSGNEMYT